MTATARGRLAVHPLRAARLVLGSVLVGGEVRARIAAAKAAGIPVLASSEPSSDLDELLAAAEDMQFPVFVKAVAGGGGRGMRRVDERADLAEATDAADGYISQSATLYNPAGRAAAHARQTVTVFA